MNPSTADAVPLPLGKGGRAPTCTDVTYFGRERFAVTKIKDFDGFSLGVMTQVRRERPRVSFRVKQHF